jgi:hypothetical protein
MIVAGARNGRRLELYSGERYITDAINSGSGVPLSTGNFANPVGGNIGEDNTSTNSGGGEGLAKPKSGTNLPFKSLVAGANMVITSTDDEILIVSTASGAVGEVNTSSSGGSGESLVLSKVGADLPFKSIAAGTNITIDSTSDTLTVNSLGSGGGASTVVIPWTVSGELTPGGEENQLRDGGAFTIPLASTVDMNSILVITLPDTYENFTPTVTASGGNLFRNGFGTDTVLQFVGSQKVILTSNGISEWGIDSIGGSRGADGADGVYQPFFTRTVDFTAVLGDSYDVEAIATVVEITLPTLEIGKSIIITTRTNSTQLVRVLNPTYTISGGGGSIAPGEDLLIGVGETAQLLATSLTTLGVV